MEKEFNLLTATTEEMTQRWIKDELMNIIGLILKGEIQVMGFQEELLKTSANNGMTKKDKEKKLEELKDEIEKVSKRIIAFKETLKNIEKIAEDPTKVYK